NWYNRASVRLKASHRLLDNLQVQGNLSYSDVRANFVQKGSNISGLLLGGARTPPDFNNQQYLDTLYHLQRSYRYPRPTATSAVATRGYDNPFFVLNEQANPQNVGRTIGDVNVNYLPISWLRVAYQVGADYSGDERLVGLPQSSSGFPGGQVVQATFTTYQIDHNVTATASYHVNPDVSGEIVVGNNINVRNNRQEYIVGNNLIAPKPFKLENTVDRDPPTTTTTKVHSAGFVGQTSVDLWSQLYLSAGVRRDGFSTFGQNNRWAGFGGLATGPRKPQDNLKPERTKELTGGVDLGLFKDRADAHFTYYHDRSTDVIFLAPLAVTTGYSQQAQNAAKILNVGYEVSLNVRPLQTADVTWEVGGQWATNDNQVTDLSGATFVDLPGAFAGAPGAAVLGSRVGVLRGNDFARCGITSSISCAAGTPTGALYIDPSGFPIRDPEIRVIMDPTPRWTGSVSTSLRYKKW